jgi:small subunit ribosomal protein S6
MNTYYVTVVLKPELAESARKEILDSVTKRVSKVEKEELWGNKDLAYPIQHQTKGYFAHYYVSAEPEAVAPLDKALQLEEDILRYLIVREK